MGYQNVGTPRFYISRSNYLMATGQDPVYWAAGIWGGGNGWDDDFMRLILSMNPSNSHTLLTNQAGSGEVKLNTHFNNTDEWDINYCAILNHNLATKGQAINFASTDGTTTAGMTISEEVNWVSGSSSPVLDGFTIVKLGDRYSGNDYYKQFQIHLPDYPTSAGTHIGAISFGRYFDMPHSPDLSLTMSHEYDGIKTIKTKGGSTLSNANYYKPPKWGELDAWQLKFPVSDSYPNYNPSYHMSGRRTWSLSFSYISDKNLEPYNHSGYEWLSDTVVTGQAHLPAQDNFFSDVLRYTMGGHLPFIFCPDPSIVFFDATDGGLPPRVPEFAICRFDMNSFQRQQVANNVYNIKLKIVESW